MYYALCGHWIWLATFGHVFGIHCVWLSYIPTMFSNNSSFFKGLILDYDPFINLLTTTLGAILKTPKKKGLTRTFNPLATIPHNK